MTTEKRKIAFTANGQRIAITVEFREKAFQGIGQTVDLEPVPETGLVLSITGEVAGSAGQCADEVREAGEGCPPVEFLCDIWDRWHLNDMRAGSRQQTEFLNSLPKARADYSARAALLNAAALNEPYRYGSAWLFEPIPENTIAALRETLDRLDGADLGEAPDLDSLPDIEGEDIIDSRDVVERYEGYRLAVVAMGLDPDNIPECYRDHETVSEYRALRELNDAGECYAGDWAFGATLVADEHFTEYAEELAKDIGAVNGDATWPNNHIDWEAAADALKADYTAIESKGARYWVR